jgi:hypothetical protein
VRAWYLAEGDVLPGGERVLYRDDWLVIARRATPDTTADPGDGEAALRGGLWRSGLTDVVGWLVRAAPHPSGGRGDGAG